MNRGLPVLGPTRAIAADDVLKRHRTPHPFDERPLLAIWELTQACDLACVHCRASAVRDRDPRELTTAEGKRLLDAVASMGTPLMVLTGGDPAKRPDLVDLVAHGARAGLTMAVTPSGTGLMTRELLARMRDAGLARLAVSVDGPDAETHDAFRRVEGSFAHSLRILSDAWDLGIERQVNTTLGHHNLYALPAMARLVAEVGAVLWSVFVVVPTGRATSSLMLGANALERALGELAALAEGAPFDVKTTAAPHFRRIQLERRSRSVGVLSDVDSDGHVRGPRGVNDGAGLLFVSHRGDVYPSGFLPLRAGNVRTDDLAELYRTSPVFTRLRDSSALGGKCGVCPFKLVCGGSRARAYAVTGDPLQADSVCAYVPKGWVTRAAK
jgi:radical SAM protein